MLGYDFIICDLDGTLCDIRHREHLAQQGLWSEFHLELKDDAPRKDVLSFLRCVTFGDGHNQVIFLTGRPDTNRAQTVEWLWDKAELSEGSEYIELLMRPKDDWRSDFQVKQELLEDFLRQVYEQSGMGPEEYKSRVLILDDRDKVVAHFRDLGYVCWQVDQGAY